jgi:hypothetical protein
VWDLSFGNVKASMSASDALSALAAVQSFAFNMEDIVNAPAPELIPELLPDGRCYAKQKNNVDVDATSSHVFECRSCQYLHCMERRTFGRRDHVAIRDEYAVQRPCWMLISEVDEPSLTIC